MHKCHHEGCCSTDKESCSQHECPCCCHKQQSHEHTCNWTEKFLELADDAWMEVLKEKIKKHIESTSGQNLDQLTKLISEANQARWHSKMASKKGCDDFKHRLAEFFSQKK